MFSHGTSLVPSNSTVFLSKFCFSFNPKDNWRRIHGKVDYDQAQEESGLLEVNISSPDWKDHQRVHLLLFDDEAHSYPGPSGAWDALPCEERIKHAKNVFRLDKRHQKFRVHIREKLRPRWWYVALADCSGTGLNVEYKVHAKNTLYSEGAVEFSMDKKFALPAFLILSVIFTCLAAAQLWANLVLAANSYSDDAGSKAAHPFARLLAAGILLELAACMLEALHLWIYSYDGHGNSVLHASSLLLSTCSNFVIASLLLLVSQGKCVSYRMVVADAHRMCQLLGPFLVSCLCLELWGDFATSRTYTTDYAYTTRCGWMIILVDLGLLASYVHNIRATLSKEAGQADGLFYRTWGAIYGTWFLALPFSAALSQAVLAPYVWYIVSLAITKSCTALVYAALVVGLWPENSRTHFKWAVSCLVASPEELMETCPSPPSRRQEATFPVELQVGNRIKQWIKRPQDLPKLLGKEGFTTDPSSPKSSWRNASLGTRA